MKKVAIFRSFAREAIKNSHVSIKACWTILFTGGTFALLHSFDELVECKFPDLTSNLFVTSCSRVPDNFSFGISMSLFLVYVLTFYRFYVGNIRVFDIRYDEVFKFIDSLHDPKNQLSAEQKDAEQEERDYDNLLEYSDRLGKEESLFLIIPALIIVYLTVTPSNPLKFLWVYLALLAADIIWLFWSLRPWAPGVKSREYLVTRFFDSFPELKGTPFERKLPETASTRWGVNNCVFAVVILVILLAHLAIGNKVCSLHFCVLGDLACQEILLAAGALAALLNCGTDLIWTWDFYNPKFGEDQKRIVEKDAKFELERGHDAQEA